MIHGSLPKHEILHVLIIPSEEFLPKENHLAGIFQYHQARALKDRGIQVGVLSVKLVYSIPMFARALILRLVKRRANNVLDDLSVRAILKLFWAKLARPRLFLSAEEIDGLSVVRIEGFYFLPPSPRTDYIGWVRAGKVAFEEYCRIRGIPDLIHAHNLNPGGILADQLAKASQVPYVVTEHSTYYARKLVPRSLFPRLRHAANVARSVAVVSPGLGQQLSSVLGLSFESMEWIPNLIEPGIADLPLRATERQDTFRFISIGNLIPVKGHELLLRAFAKSFAGNGGVELRIAGDGPLDTLLEDLTKELGIESQVTFLGRLSRKAVITELDTADALVLSSLVETFGVVLIEAMARGKPVVATRCGGPEWIISADDGIVVDSGDVDALANGMDTMLKCRNGYHDHDIRQRAFARFGSDHVAGLLESFYRDALGSAQYAG
jgi:glycosyltransferase involved in cell wall biosynthesis